MHYIPRFVCLGLGLAWISVAATPCGGSSGSISYVCDGTRLLSVKYLGVEYFDHAGWARALPITYGAYFSDGTNPGNGARVSESGPAYSQLTFASNTAYSYRVRLDYSIPDATTLKITLSLSNLSSIAAIESMKTLVPMSIMMKKPYQVISYGTTQPVNGSNDIFVQMQAASVAYFSTNYIDNWYSSLVSAYPGRPDSQHDSWNVGIVNSQANGPVSFTTPLPPQTTKTMDLYLRFGAPGASRQVMEAESTAALQAVYPPTISWPDRRPIATWFLADHGHTSATNPRGYFSDTACNCLDQPTFHARLQSALSQFLAVVNSQPVQPQAVVLWDMEGQEYPQVMTYVGNPPLLNALAPEMDAEIDSVLATLAANGYRVGMTLRPHKIVAGTPLPASCNYDPNQDYNDRFLLTDGIPQARYYVCNSNGTFVTYGGIAGQISYADTDSVLTELSNKVSYAMTRWGASVFYVDSVVWSGGSPYLSDVWAQLAAKFPNCLFLPEQKLDRDYAYVAPYSDAHQSNVWSSASHRVFYPSGFAAINLGNTTQNELSAGYADISGTTVSWASGPLFTTGSTWVGKAIYVNGMRYVVRGVSSTKQLTLTTPVAVPIANATWRVSGYTDSIESGMVQGDVYMYPGWFSSWYQTATSAIFQEANYTVVVTDSATRCLRAVSAAPGGGFGIPLTMKVFFASTPGGVATSTTSCVPGASCVISLQGTPYYQAQYFDLSGILVTQGSVLQLH